MTKQCMKCSGAGILYEGDTNWSPAYACSDCGGSGKFISMTDTVTKLLNDLHPHILALSVSDDDPQFKQLLERLETILKG